MNLRSVQTRLQNIVRSPYFVEAVQRLGLACLLCVLLNGGVIIGPTLSGLCYTYFVNALFPLIGAGVVMSMLFTLLLAPFIGKERCDRFRSWVVGACLRIGKWFVKKLVVSLFYTVVFALRVTLALFCPGKIANQVRSAMKLYGGQIRDLAGLKGS
jgi:hypothetical protein